MSDSGPADRLYPPRPILAASTAVFRDGRVLIARRARAPWLGAFSLPGGVVEIGETLVEAVLRELREEVGVEAEIAGFVRHVEAIHRDAPSPQPSPTVAHPRTGVFDALSGEGGLSSTEPRVRAHFVIAVFAARWSGGEPRLSDEVSEIAWVDPLALGDRPTTPELADILARAARLSL